jgi:hypothetical protein
VAGTLILIASLAFHGDLPTHVSVSAALRFIADHDYWLLMHVGTVVAPLVWLGAIAALAGTAVGGRARAVGRLLVPIGVVGATFSVFTFSIDGYVFKILADAWAVASGTEQRELLAMTTTLLKLLTGPFRIEIPGLVWADHHARGNRGLPRPALPDVVGTDRRWGRRWRTRRGPGIPGREPAVRRWPRPPPRSTRVPADPAGGGPLDAPARGLHVATSRARADSTAEGWLAGANRLSPSG